MKTTHQAKTLQKPAVLVEKVKIAAEMNSHMFRFFRESTLADSRTILLKFTKKSYSILGKHVHICRPD